MKKNPKTTSFKSTPRKVKDGLVNTSNLILDYWSNLPENLIKYFRENVVIYEYYFFGLTILLLSQESKYSFIGYWVSNFFFFIGFFIAVNSIGKNHSGYKYVKDDIQTPFVAIISVLLPLVSYVFLVIVAQK